MMNVGLVGCGNIGADICIALQKRTIPACIAALTDADPSRARVLLRSFQLNASICTLDQNAGKTDYIIECASADVVPDVLEAAIRHQTNCLILSAGGLMSHPELYDRARDAGVEVHLPSGALCGLDGIRAAMESGLHHVTLTTRKPPKGLEGAPYLEDRGIDLYTLDEPVVLFEGNAIDACRAFPQNVNVAAALSFAGIGPRETMVRVIVDPDATVNTHEVVAEGAFGRLKTVTENLPSPRNAKSSYLASLSAIAELRSAAMTFLASHPAAQARVASNS